MRDEEESLPCLLAALADLDRGAAAPVACFLLDGCRDASEAVLRAAASSLPFPLLVAHLPHDPSPNAGRARRAAMALGVEQVGTSGLLLTTDADSRPHPDWLQASVRALALADAATGLIVRRDGARDAAHTRMERYLDRLHAHRRRLDPLAWDHATGHHYCGGANLAIRVSAYVALGGVRPIASAEDATLIDDAARAGFRVRRDPAMVVETSSRRHGRAPGGLAAALMALDAAEPPHVAHPAAAAWQYRAHAEARRCFGEIDTPAARARLGALIGLSPDHVLGVARDCPNEEAFAMRIVPAAPGGERLVSLDEAEQALAALDAALLERAA